MFSLDGTFDQIIKNRNQQTEKSRQKTVKHVFVFSFLFYNSELDYHVKNHGKKEKIKQKGNQMDKIAVI